MRLIQVSADGSFSLARYESTSIPPYAILSHTWAKDEDEVTYEDMQNKTGQEKTGYAKMLFCADRVAENGLQHFWIDTCCIDKTSSAELAESITSMFRWYKDSDQCYVYLTDVTINKRKADHEAAHPTWMSAFRTSRWFTRGWTLQELLAPSAISFFSREEKELGNKLDLEQHIHEVTRIPIPALRGLPLHEFSIPDRMSWAASRETKREEDKAYSLCGIFGVSMVPNYGELQESAFRGLRKEIREIAENDTTSVEEEEKQMFMKTLRFDQIDARHTTIKNAYTKTCRWLLSKREYVDWLDTKKLPQHHGFLWIKGKPGTGKSTLMKFAFSKTSKTKTIKHSVVIAFFFNARGELLEKSVTGMYRSLLLQLLEQVPDLQCTFRSSSLSSSSVNTEYQWSVNSLEAQLEQAILSLGSTPVICFIDALDECEERQGLSFELEGQEGHTQDINDYLGSELKIGDSKIARQIRADLQRKASGVFMWVVLVVDILQREYDRGRMYALEQRLRDIPADLHRLFHDILTRDSRDREGLILSIQWVLFAKQPLSPEQLYLAILSGVEPELVSRWDPSAISEQDAIRRFILDTSKGLTEITKSKSQRVQFIHESVRDFLLKDDGLGTVWPDLKENFEGQSHERVKQCCLTIMHSNMEHYTSIPHDCAQASSEELTEARAVVTKSFPILDYAVQNILHHADAAQGAGIDQKNFMVDFPLNRWIRLANFFEKRKVRRYTSLVSVLYILGDRNMSHLIRSSTSAKTCFEVEAERYGAPFLAAVATRSKAAVCAFVDVLNEAIGARKSSLGSYVHFYQGQDGESLLPRDFKFSKQRNIVDYLSELDDEAALCLAITTTLIDVNAKLSDGETLLIRAARKGRTDLVGLLLGTNKVDLDAKDRMGQTALILAANNGHKHVLELLLSINKANFNARDMIGNTSLMWAANTGHKEVVELLLRTDEIDTGRTTDSRSLLLMLAAQAGHEDTVELLLSTDKIDVNMKSNEGASPLMLAANAGHNNVVSLLLSTNRADIDARSNDGWSPLMLAARAGHTAIAEMLLRSGKAKIDARDNRGSTPLIFSAQNGQRDTVELLLRHMRHEINAKDNSGRSALSWAASGGQSVFRDILPQTPISKPTALEDYQMQLMLLEQQNKKRLMLARAEKNAFCPWIKLLMMTELLTIADHQAVVKLLLDMNELDVNSEDDNGHTPIFWAVITGNVALVKLLLDTNKVDLEKTDKDGSTALMLAADNDQSEIAHLLRSGLPHMPIS
ncbi:hypothetical protein OPT61_g4195 [Boeremia exigua]|uniref:Uncharacterized protein n=1 Tax=Boeremia exigua TaxID=749465 RepID=A0ACC2IEV8_9PLEO|nr:hypothetical protein OPT61_g4195 [Boeremia exigua]